MNWSETILQLPVRLWSALVTQAMAWWRSIYLAAVILVLVLSPSSYQRGSRRMLAQQIYAQTAPVLTGFTLLAALLCAVIARIVMVTAQSYGLSRYALDLVVRVMVIELIPLTAVLFVPCAAPFRPVCRWCRCAHAASSAPGMRMAWTPYALRWCRVRQPVCLRRSHWRR